MPYVIERDTQGWSKQEKDDMVQQMKNQGYRLARKNGSVYIFVEKKDKGDRGSFD